MKDGTSGVQDRSGAIRSAISESASIVTEILNRIWQILNAIGRVQEGPCAIRIELQPRLLMSANRTGVRVEEVFL